MPHDRLLSAVLLLAVGTLLLRLTGPLLRARTALTPHLQTVLTTGVAVLFTAVVATSTLLEGQHLAGPARPAGVAVAGLLAWKRAPFALVVLAAAATTAGLRLADVP
jgi:branched-subunit amino acid transport protein